MEGGSWLKFDGTTLYQAFITTVKILQKIFQVFLKFSFYVFAAAQAFELQDSFPVDGVVAGSPVTLYRLLITLLLSRRTGKFTSSLSTYSFAAFTLDMRPVKRQNTRSPGLCTDRGAFAAI